MILQQARGVLAESARTVKSWRDVRSAVKGDDAYAALERPTASPEALRLAEEPSETEERRANLVHIPAYGGEYCS
ncbi:hypothetical protein AB0I27_06765 [Streptomyces sp. NPDC050597]|uniref:hypothetical protein n=1 Tax=Streptomyces sp. NPDC050597 TaxID=3157212 RepID=UPI0034335C34